MIPMVDLRAQYQTLRADLEPAIAEAMAEARYVLGPNVEAFEDEAAAYLDVEHAVACGSGTDALHLALAAHGVGPGDEVITTPFTFVATAEAIRHVGATPVFVDVDRATFNIAPSAVDAAVTAHTAAILPVHLFGQPADMPRLREIASVHGLLLIEDCAQSFGATVDGRPTGGIGDAGAFSFFPSKNLGAFGDGGLVTTHEAEVAARIRALRNHGQRERYRHEETGFNSRLDELQAVVLRHKLLYVDDYNAGRQRVADRYDAGLAGLPIVPPHRDGVGTHVFQQYTILTEDRDAVRAALDGAGIASAIYYHLPLHRQEAFADHGGPPSRTVADELARLCLSLPMYPELVDADVDRICAVIGDVVGP